MKKSTKVILGTMTFGAQTNRADAVKMMKLFSEKYGRMNGANAEVRIRRVTTTFNGIS